MNVDPGNAYVLSNGHSSPAIDEESVQASRETII
jgi:hypothetical protein